MRGVAESQNPARVRLRITTVQEAVAASVAPMCIRAGSWMKVGGNPVPGGLIWGHGQLVMMP